MKRYITKYTEDGKLYAEAWDQINIFGKAYTFHRRRIEIPVNEIPVKHGRWIPISDQVAKCSLCGMYETTHGKDETGRALIHKAVKHYCPYCGALMDEEASK